MARSDAVTLTLAMVTLGLGETLSLEEPESMKLGVGDCEREAMPEPERRALGDAPAERDSGSEARAVGETKGLSEGDTVEELPSVVVKVGVGASVVLRVKLSSAEAVPPTVSEGAPLRVARAREGDAESDAVTAPVKETKAEGLAVAEALAEEVKLSVMVAAKEGVPRALPEAASLVVRVPDALGDKDAEAVLGVEALLQGEVPSEGESRGVLEAVGHSVEDPEEKGVALSGDALADPVMRREGEVPALVVKDALSASLVVRVPVASDCEAVKDATEAVGALAEALGVDDSERLPVRLAVPDDKARALPLAEAQPDTTSLAEGEDVPAMDT